MNVFESLAKARVGRGKVFAEDSSQKWHEISGALTRGFILHVRDKNGYWFIPVQWEVR